MFGNREPRHSLTSITGNTGNSRSSGQSAIIIFALLVYIECPALIYGFLDKHINDHRFESELAVFTSEYVQQNFWPRARLRYADKFHWNKYRFAVPYMKDGMYNEYPSSTIMPFVNETRLGRVTETGEFVNEGSFSNVFAFDILDEYRAFAVSR